MEPPTPSYEPDQAWVDVVDDDLGLMVVVPVKRFHYSETWTSSFCRGSLEYHECCSEMVRIPSVPDGLCSGMAATVAWACSLRLVVLWWVHTG